MITNALTKTYKIKISMLKCKQEKICWGVSSQTAPYELMLTSDLNSMKAALLKIKIEHTPFSLVRL